MAARTHAEARDPGDIFGSRPTSQAPARRPQQRLQTLHLLGQHDRADALGAADFVRGKREQIGLHRFDIEGYFSERLDCIDMQQPAGCMHDSATSATG